jgi:hypothetical protein
MMTIHATDIMDQIHCSLRVSQWDGLGSAPDEIYESACTYPGVGENDLHIWVKSALLQMLDIS